MLFHFSRKLRCSPHQFLAICLEYYFSEHRKCGPGARFIGPERTVVVKAYTDSDGDSFGAVSGPHEKCILELVCGSRFSHHSDREPGGGAAGWEIVLHQPTNREHHERLRATRHRDPARQFADDIPAILRSRFHLGASSVLSIRKLVLPQRLLRLWRRHTDGIVLWRRMGWMGRMGLGVRLGRPQHLCQ